MLLKNEKLTALLDMLADEASVYVPCAFGGFGPDSDEADSGEAAGGAEAVSTGAAPMPAASANADGAPAPLARPLDASQSCFVPYQKGDALDFGTARTAFSPKALLFPQTEILYTYAQHGEELSIHEVEHQTRQLLFGVRSCDVYSIDRLDEVFLTRGYVDTAYYRRRSHTLIVALGCTKPARSCFCSSFGIDPSFAPGADVQLTPTDGGFIVEALSSAGREAVQSWEPFLVEAPQTDSPTAEALSTEAQPARAGHPASPELTFSLSIDTRNIKEALEGMFEDPYWNDLSLTCLNCGTCAFVCPSCHCFDMGQNNRGNEGYRFRTWDSCMFTDYTLMAGFHNPRPTKKERLRNRFMHKLSFYEERYGSPMCCGCGRCIEMCPVGIDIGRIIEDAQEVAAHA